VSPLPTKDIRRALCRKGFREDETHHTMFWFWHDGRKTSVRTYLSHGAKEYPEGLLGAVAREMKLKNRDLRRFVDCSMDAAEYQRVLLSGGHVRP
jgi:hypothetical protein